MKVSTKGRYALRVMVNLALQKDKEQFISLKEIAQEEKISMKYLEQIVAMLNREGFLDVARGNNGGYRLARKPEEYRLSDILKATEGKLILIDCIEEENLCERKGICKTHNFWQGLNQAMIDYLDSKTLADLL